MGRSSRHVRRSLQGLRRKPDRQFRSPERDMPRFGSGYRPAILLRHNPHASEPQWPDTERLDVGPSRNPAETALRPRNLARLLDASDLGQLRQLAPLRRNRHHRGDQPRQSPHYFGLHPIECPPVRSNEHHILYSRQHGRSGHPSRLWHPAFDSSALCKASKPLPLFFMQNPVGWQPDLVSFAGVDDASDLSELPFD